MQLELFTLNQTTQALLVTEGIHRHVDDATIVRASDADDAAAATAGRLGRGNWGGAWDAGGCEVVATVAAAAAASTTTTAVAVAAGERGDRSVAK